MYGVWSLHIMNVQLRRTSNSKQNIMTGLLGSALANVRPVVRTYSSPPITVRLAL